MVNDALLTRSARDQTRVHAVYRHERRQQRDRVHPGPYHDPMVGLGKLAARLDNWPMSLPGARRRHERPCIGYGRSPADGPVVVPNRGMTARAAKWGAPVPQPPAVST